MSLTPDRLREVLKYHKTTGNFVWRVRTSNRVRVGEVAGTLHDEGYIKITVDGAQYLAHRLAHLYVLGRWPEADVDHRNTDRADNRWRNIRPATRAENMQNLRKAHADSQTGILGVTPADGRFSARISSNGVTVRLGRYDTPKQAGRAYVHAKRKLHTFGTL
jgi:hypothetical protein